MEKGKIYLRSGARELRLPSGDKGLYIDICIEDLERILKEHEPEEIKRPWYNKSEEKEFNNIRIFAIPKTDSDDSTFYPYYLEIARNIKKQ